MEAFEKLGISIMPANLHQSMTTQELVDLVDYLSTLNTTETTNTE